MDLSSLLRKGPKSPVAAFRPQDSTLLAAHFPSHLQSHRTVCPPELIRPDPPRLALHLLPTSFLPAPPASTRSVPPPPACAALRSVNPGGVCGTFSWAHLSAIPAVTLRGQLLIHEQACVCFIDASPRLAACHRQPTTLRLPQRPSGGGPAPQPHAQSGCGRVCTTNSRPSWKHPSTSWGASNSRSRRVPTAASCAPTADLASSATDSSCRL